MTKLLTGLGAGLIFLNFPLYLLLKNLPPTHGILQVFLMFFGGICLVVAAYRELNGLSK